MIMHIVLGIMKDRSAKTIPRIKVSFYCGNGARVGRVESEGTGKTWLPDKVVSKFVLNEQFLGSSP